MPAGNAYPSGHLVSSLLGLAYMYELYVFYFDNFCQFHYVTLIQNLTFIDLIEISMDHLQWVWYANRERLPFQTPGSIPFWNLHKSNCWNQFSQTWCDFLDFSHQISFVTTLSIYILKCNYWREVSNLRSLCLVRVTKSKHWRSKCVLDQIL